MPWSPKPNKPAAKRQHARTTTERGYGWDWQQFQARHVKGKLCVDCEAKGIMRPATEGHHVQKVKDRPDRKLDEDNVTPLCKPCHTKRTAKGE